MTTQYMERIRRGWANRIIYWIVAAVFVVPLACICVCAPLAYALTAPAGDSTPLIVLAISMGLFIVVILAVGAGAIIWMVVRLRQTS